MGIHARWFDLRSRAGRATRGTRAHFTAVGPKAPRVGSGWAALAFDGGPSLPWKIEHAARGRMGAGQHARGPGPSREASPPARYQLAHVDRFALSTHDLEHPTPGGCMVAYNQHHPRGSCQAPRRSIAGRAEIRI